MAVGYSRTATVQVLLDFGADPEAADKEDRTVLDLVEKLRAAMPLTPELLGRRTMLEDVAGVLTGTELHSYSLHLSVILYSDSCRTVSTHSRSSFLAVRHCQLLQLLKACTPISTYCSRQPALRRQRQLLAGQPPFQE